MEPSEHNWASMSETICPTVLSLRGRRKKGRERGEAFRRLLRRLHGASFWQVGHLDVFLSEYPDESHNLTNLIFMTSSL